MLEKIKTLLDSGCWVEVEYDREGIIRKNIFTAYEDEEEDFIIYGMLYKTLFRGSNNETYLRDRDEWDSYKIEILSIKPIARPLYEYKVGDKVVVLDNYEDEMFHGIVGVVIAIGLGIVLIGLKEDGWSIPINIRCIAPVLD